MTDERALGGARGAMSSTIPPVGLATTGTAGVTAMIGRVTVGMGEKARGGARGEKALAVAATTVHATATLSQAQDGAMAEGRR